MKIALLGYGKMGKTIERIAEERGHEIILKITDNAATQDLSRADIAIEFSVPQAASMPPISALGSIFSLS